MTPLPMMPYPMSLSIVSTVYRRLYTAFEAHPLGMKIQSVETFPLQWEMSQPRGPSVYTYRQRETLIVKLTTDDGLVGWGETYFAPSVVTTIQQQLAPLLLGQRAVDHRALWAVLAAASFDNAYAVSGVDIALHDLWGKTLGVPIHQLYGGALRTRLPAYASMPGYFENVPPENHWVEETLQLQRLGFQAMKLRVGRYPSRREVPTIGKVRDALPPHIKLMADGNGAYTLPDAITTGNELAHLGLTWFEEPLPQDGYRGYPELRRKLSIALAGGEVVQTRAGFAELLERGAFDVIQPDVSICGGIREVLFVAELAQLSAVQCMPHCWGGAVSLAATLQVVSLLAEPTRLQGNEIAMIEYDVTENRFRTDLVAEPMTVDKDGCIALPDGPGLGVTVDEEVLRHYAAR
jgi:D-galactarolactone cycloisomerase